jgi:hypothetical protein
MTEHYMKVWQDLAFKTGWREALTESHERILKLIEEVEEIRKDSSAPEWLKLDTALRLEGLRAAERAIQKLAYETPPQYQPDNNTQGGDDE